MIHKKSDFAGNLDKIYRDIRSIKIDSKDSLESLMNKFYSVMRKWSICQGIWSEYGSRNINNPEWSMCFQVFFTYMVKHLEFKLLISEPPKDLLAYGKKPTVKNKLKK